VVHARRFFPAVLTMAFALTEPQFGSDHVAGDTTAIVEAIRGC